MELITYIQENSLVLIPVMYVIAEMIKGTSLIDNKYLPIVLLVISILLQVLVRGVCADTIVQGVIVAGVTVYGNQLIKQFSK